MAAPSIEEQDAATIEIARNIQGAADSTRRVSETSPHFTGAAHRTGEAAGQSMEAASILHRESSQLAAAVQKFVRSIRQEA